jgi:hypothetical protein
VASGIHPKNSSAHGYPGYASTSIRRSNKERIAEVVQKGFVNYLNYGLEEPFTTVATANPRYDIIDYSIMCSRHDGFYGADEMNSRFG